MPFDAPPPTADAVTSIDGEAPGTEVGRLPFVDGVRGFAAMVVLLGHLIFKVPTRHYPALADAGPVDLLAWPFRFGTEMVYLFLIISGFSLHYSEVARRSRGRRQSTLGEYFARRAWRIGPVYYLAVVLGLASSPFLAGFRLYPPDMALGHVTVGGLISHLIFAQNERASWYTQINGPLWSIGFEVQLYLLFPLIFWAARRWNPLLVCGGIAIADLVVNTQASVPFPLFGLARWFALGILIAELTARGLRVPLKVSLPIGLTALVVAGAQIASISDYVLRHDAIWAIAFTGVLLALIEHPVSRRNPFTWRPWRWLGLRSYSIYALHWPLVALLIFASVKLRLTGWTASGVVTAVGLPAAVLLAAVSFRFVEGPSLERVARIGRPASTESLTKADAAAEQKTS